MIRWWEVDPASRLGDSDVTRKGSVGAAGRDAAWPSIATDGDGKVWVNYARAGAAECLSAYAGVIQPGAIGVRFRAHPRGFRALRVHTGFGTVG